MCGVTEDGNSASGTPFLLCLLLAAGFDSWTGSGKALASILVIATAFVHHAFL